MVEAPFLLIGLGLGVRHATDPDHVAALWNFVNGEQSRRHAVRYAVSWGLGHATSFTCVGLLVLLGGLRPAPWFEWTCQTLAGLMLLLLGVHRFQSRIRYFQSYVPAPAPEVGRPRRATFCVGLVHGLAGSAAIALLLLASQPSRSTAVGYLFMFGAGSVAGMVGLTLTLLLPLRHLASRVGAQARFASLVPSLLSVVLGAAILFNTFRDYCSTR